MQGSAHAAGASSPTRHDELGPEQLGGLVQHVVVNQPSLLVEAVRHRLSDAAVYLWHWQCQQLGLRGIDAAAKHMLCPHSQPATPQASHKCVSHKGRTSK